jgi:hypothetical protein
LFKKDKLISREELFMSTKFYLFDKQHKKYRFFVKQLREHIGHWFFIKQLCEHIERRDVSAPFLSENFDIYIFFIEEAYASGSQIEFPFYLTKMSGWSLHHQLSSILDE